MKKLVIIFTRNPELGKCKTRLAQSIGDKNALQIYKKLIQHTALVAEKSIREEALDVAVFYSEEISKKDYWSDDIFIKKKQIEGDLGEKMQAAFEWGFQKKYHQICIIGSDLFDLQSADIRLAFEKLHLNDLVFGPAEDGGYYLMGMKKIHPPIFKVKKWGSESVLSCTLAEIKSQKIAFLDTKNDIDVVEDLVPHQSFQKYIPTSILENYT
ncbi:MAG: TIGR04282 family arsenosugar biosynthesis glycosyltransferase [Bacteroidota bacterium]